jgi:hypothetical protein
MPSLWGGICNKALTGVSGGSSGPPSSEVLAAVASRNRGRQLPTAAVLLWPGHTVPTAEIAGRAQQDHPCGGFHQEGCLRDRESLPVLIPEMYTALSLKCYSRCFPHTTHIKLLSTFQCGGEGTT